MSEDRTKAAERANNLIARTAPMAGLEHEAATCAELALRTIRDNHLVVVADAGFAARDTQALQRMHLENLQFRELIRKQNQAIERLNKSAEEASRVNKGLETEIRALRNKLHELSDTVIAQDARLRVNAGAPEVHFDMPPSTIVDHDSLEQMLRGLEGPTKPRRKR